MPVLRRALDRTEVGCAAAGADVREAGGRLMHLPDDLPDDVLGAALDYAVAGFYVLPINRTTKHAGSVLGKGWPAKSSRDPKVIAAMFAGTGHGLALHLGRSGAMGFDVDNPGKLAAVLTELFAATTPPFQSTRVGQPGRGHYLFRVPEGRSIGNSLGHLPSEWGEIRGRNGIIVVEPTVHSKAEQGGRYRWESTGIIPMLPDAIADLLPDAMNADDAATDAEVTAFLATYTEGSKPERLAPIVARYKSKVAAGGSRHDTLVACLTWACKEVIAGYVPARRMRGEFLGVHLSALADDTHPNGAEPNRKDFGGALAWALSQALTDELKDTMPGPDTTEVAPHSPRNPQKANTAVRSGSSADSADSVDALEDFTGDPDPLERITVLPAFPVQVLPLPIADLVLEVAESTQTDEGMAGAVALGVMAAAAGGFAEVQVRPGYVEPLNLWVAPAALPAERKSSVCTLLTAPLVALEAELVEHAAPLIEEARTLKEIAEKIAEGDKRTAGNAAPDKRDAAASAAVTSAQQAAALTVPSLPQIIADDVTLEALGSRLAEQGGRLAVVSTEGGFLATAAGRYSASPDLSVPLKAHAGDRIRVDRMGRATEFVNKPALTLVMMVQPGVLAAAASNTAFHDSGFLARFLFAFPPSRLGRRAVDPAPLDPATLAAYSSRIATVATALRRAEQVQTLTLDPAADAVRLDFARRIEVQLGPDGELAHVRGWAGKIVGATVRIAGLLHLLEQGTSADTITAKSMRGAVALGDYFTAHAVHAFDTMAARDDDLELARRVVALIGRKPEFREFSTRDVMIAAPRSWMPDTATMGATLDQLVDYGWILPLPEPQRPEGKQGRTPSKRYRAHPWCHDRPPQNPQNPRNDSAATANPSSVDSVDNVEPPRRLRGAA